MTALFVPVWVLTITNTDFIGIVDDNVNAFVFVLAFPFSNPFGKCKRGTARKILLIK